MKRLGGMVGRAALWIAFVSCLWAGHAGGEPLPTQKDDSQREETECFLAEDGAAFVDALNGFRGGDDDALKELLLRAERLALGCGREDARAIAAFYAALSPESRAAGLAAEATLDDLRERASQLEVNDRSGAEALLREAVAFAPATRNLRDLPVHAHVLSLSARLGARSLEGQFGLNEAELRGVESAALKALDLFERSGQVTPTLEPRWVLARCALLAGDLRAAEVRFTEVAEIAERVGQTAWRERGLLGSIGLARERGSLFDAGSLLEELAEVRDAASCWSLAREVAVQHLSLDEGETALAWLERYPPSAEDTEIELATARAEWRTLKAAAELRLGRTGAAARRLGGLDGTREWSALDRLTRATIHLEGGEPQRALELLGAAAKVNAGAGAAPGAAGLNARDRLVLRGRALLALGRPEEAIQDLEEALRLAQAGGASTAASVARGSRIGEWFGLSTVEALGRAYVATGDALGAAAVFEAAHAPQLDREACRRELLDRAGRATHGLVTWMVGADRSSAVHIDAQGIAASHEIPLGRAALRRGIERLRGALRETPEGHGDPELAPWRPLALELFQTLIPPSAQASLVYGLGEAGKGDDGWGDGGTLIVLPHGVLELLPLEALIASADDEPLGCRVALSVVTRLREAAEIAPPLAVETARWIGLGSPTSQRFAPLPGAEEELRSLAAMWPRWTTRSGHSATLDAARAALESGAPVHLATHVVRTGAPAHASIAPLALAFAGDELLTADELCDLGPRLPLAVLTACGSADGLAVDGLSVRGVAQAFLGAGTRTALVTLWPIEDRAGMRASVRMHAALLSGASPAEATRRARHFLKQLGEPPSEWAAYRCLE